VVLAPQGGARIFPYPIDDFLGGAPAQSQAAGLEVLEVDLG